MRRLLTWGLVAAVAALVLAAGIDALRGGGEPEPAAATEAEPATTGEVEPAEGTLPAAAADLREAGVPEGRLVWSDEDCGVHSLLLPSLAERPVHDLVACQSEGASFSQPGGIRAECAGGLLRIWAGPLGEPELVARERGCGPAWKPDRSVTFVQDGGIRRFAPCPGDPEAVPLRCSEPVVTRAELVRQLAGSPGSSSRRFEEILWLDDERFAAIVSAPSAAASEYLLVFRRGRMVQEPTFRYADLSGLRLSPTGRFIAAYDAGRGIAVVDERGEPVDLVMDRGRGIAWSPDEEWIAEATEGGIWIFRADGSGPAPVRVPIPAEDILWSEP